MANGSADNAIQAVIFDFGGVLSRGDIVQLIFDTEQKYGLPQYTIFKLGAEGQIGVRLDKGLLTLEEAAELINGIIRPKIEGPFDLFDELETADKSFLEPCEDMEELARRLRKEGLKLAVVSNNWKKSHENDQRYLDVDQSLFDVVIDSCAVGMRKPDAEIYQLVLDRLGVQAHQAIFLDDLKANIEGAEKVGIKGIHVDPSHKAMAIQQLGRWLQLDLSPEISSLT